MLHIIDNTKSKKSILDKYLDSRNEFYKAELYEKIKQMFDSPTLSKEDIDKLVIIAFCKQEYSKFHSLFANHAQYILESPNIELILSSCSKYSTSNNSSYFAFIKDLCIKKKLSKKHFTHKLLLEYMAIKDSKHFVLFLFDFFNFKKKTTETLLIDSINKQYHNESLIFLYHYCDKSKFTLKFLKTICNSTYSDQIFPLSLLKTIDFSIVKTDQKKEIMSILAKKAIDHISKVHVKMIEFLLTKHDFPYEIFPNKNYFLTVLCYVVGEKHFPLYINLFDFLITKYKKECGNQFIQNVIENENGFALNLILEKLPHIQYPDNHSFAKIALCEHKPNVTLMKKCIELYSNKIPPEMLSLMNIHIFKSMPVIDACISVLEES